MNQLKAEHIAKIRRNMETDQILLTAVEQDLPKAWKDVPKYLELLRKKRIIEGRIHIAKLKISNLEKGKEVLAA